MALAGRRDVGGRSGTAATDDFQAEPENPRRERTAEEPDVFMLLRGTVMVRLENPDVEG